MSTQLDRVRTAGGIATVRVALWAMARSGDLLAPFLRSTPIDDVYGLFARIRARGPVYRSRTGIHVVTSHALCGQVLRDPRFRVRDLDGRPADHDPLTSGTTGPLSESLLEQDPPVHTRLRRLVAPAFRPAAIRAYRPRIEAVAHDLLDRAAHRGSFDLIADFATPLPITVIAEMLGIAGADTERFARFGAVVGQSISGVSSLRQARELREAGDDLVALFVRLERERRDHPGDDVISSLAAHRAAGRLELDELVAACQLLLIAGFETTVNLLGNATAALTHHPEQWNLLRSEPDRAAAAIEETLRYDPPVQATVRVPHEPVELGGHLIAAGTRVMLMLAAAHRDPAAYSDAGGFDITRAERSDPGPDHLAFSSGIHYCLGAPLARLEGEVALRALAARLPELRPAGPPRRRRGNAIRGYAAMPLNPPAL